MLDPKNMSLVIHYTSSNVWESKMWCLTIELLKRILPLVGKKWLFLASLWRHFIWTTSTSYPITNTVSDPWNFHWSNIHWIKTSPSLTANGIYYFIKMLTVTRTFLHSQKSTKDPSKVKEKLIHSIYKVVIILICIASLPWHPPC